MTFNILLPIETLLTTLLYSVGASDRVGFQIATSCYVLDMKQLQRYMVPSIDPDGNGNYFLVRARLGPLVNKRIINQRYTWEYPTMNLQRLHTYTVE